MIVLLQASLDGVERKEFISRRTFLWWRNMYTAIQTASGAMGLMGLIPAISLAAFIWNHGQTNFCRLLLSVLRLEASQAHRRQHLE